MAATADAAITSFHDTMYSPLIEAMPTVTVQFGGLPIRSVRAKANSFLDRMKA